ncbi:MAG: DNA mismatch repair endonuclease MutL, partial [Nitrospirae bacterium]|nr:DNA mismatch repair endonuclease MutL [Nitrospirota bacterium]
MPRINILPLSLRNKIAAGEVVERPASVIKELVENSIDAGSTRIEIDAASAGKKLIRVSDNGLGMERDDALLAFERYATSKIRNESDLFNLNTMGFRGEALSSIASVSRMKLTTAYQAGEHSSAAVGTCVEIAGGEIKEARDCSATGTSIEVKELFFNTPARRKFLKSDATESYHIIDTVTREALSHYHIGFVLRMDGDDVLNLPAASSQRERLLQIYGKDFVDGLLETESENGQMGIRAYVSKVTMLRNNRNNQFLFLNRRPVKDQSVTYAVYKAYESLIPKDRHPLFFIFLKIDASRVDFNVHPAKREVRFEDKSSVFNFVQKAVKGALRQDKGFMMKEADFRESGLQRPCEMAQGGAGLSYAAIAPDIRVSGNLVSEKLEQFYSGSTPFLYLGDTLVAVAGSGGLTIIDYHAAHERI